MVNFQYLIAAAALAFAASQAAAMPFDGSTGTTATVVVDSAGGGDYTSLKLASNAFNAVPTINRPWILYINSDLNETVRVAFGTNFAPGNSLTIKPGAGKTPTITLTNTAPGNNSFFGALLFGCNNDGILEGAAPASNPPASSIFETNNAFIIDGSNTDGGSTRDLTFLSVTDTTGNLIRVVGTTNGFVIKNSRLLMRKAAGSASAFAVGAGNIAGFGSQGGDFKSDNLVMDNCFIECKATVAGSAGIGVNYSVAAVGTLPTPKNFEGHVIRNSAFDVRHRGISALYQVNCLYEGNTFQVRYAGSGANSGAIQHLLQNGTFPTSYTVTCRNNKIIDLQTSNTSAGDFGVNGIAMSGGTNAIYKVYNNVITGIISGGASSVDQLITPIWGTGSTSAYEIEHNSINVGPQPNVTGATRSRAAGIVINTGISPNQSYIKNNIVRYAVGKGAPIVSYATGTGAVSINPANIVGNDLFQAVSSDPASPLAYIGTTLASTTAYADQAALSTAGYNLGGGQSVDPAATTPPWNADLSFSAAPVPMGKVTSSSILTDINGDVRPATNAYPGAYRIVVSGVNDWSVY